MGRQVHHAIVVTHWDNDAMKAAHAKAVEIFGKLATPIVDSGINGYSTFFVAPDGSKEGWGASDVGDNNRDRFIRWLAENSYCEGGDLDKPMYQWVEVAYGEISPAAKVTRLYREG